MLKRIKNKIIDRNFVKKKSKFFNQIIKLRSFIKISDKKINKYAILNRIKTKQN